ncbi:MAG TPA: transcriptional repressor LexA [Gemmatimonadaceae bacterium]|jgi:repressor LexA|nr:transcriptional repressor LexA [Gemmatimonadaceae bacterium]
MPESLTTLERRVYHYLLDFLGENTYQPSIREIGKRFRIKSTKTVSDILQSLADKGYIQRDPARSRGVRLLGYSTVGRMQPVPFYGKIAAGEPMLIPGNRERFITLDRAFVPSEDCFFLRVSGDSMIGRGIFDRDFVLVNPSARAHDGDIIAARVGSEATVKTLQHRGATIVLEPANPDERELVIGPNDDFAVIGTIAAVFRPFHDAGDMPDDEEPPTP